MTRLATRAFLEVTRSGSGRSGLGLHGDASENGRLGQTESLTLLRAPHPTCPKCPSLTQAACTAARRSARLCHSSASRGTRRSSQTSHRPRPRAGSPREHTPHSDTTTKTDKCRASPLQTPHPSENKVGEGLEGPRGEDPKGWGRPPSSHPRHRPHGGLEQRIKQSPHADSPRWRHLGELLNQALSQSLHSADGDSGQRGLGVGEEHW